MTRPPAVRAIALSKSFGSVVAVSELELEVGSGRMLALLGPSGCGKTTALRLIAGFESPDAGSIEIGGRRVAGPGGSVPPERRRVGMVFQDYALFPHLDVVENIGFGLQRDPDRAVRVAELLELVGLGVHGRRMPHELSGGMQQRVALARALAPRPEVLLLDEPFSSLDRALRTQLRGEVREILRQAGQSSIFVTHDQDEALTVADDVAVMVRGRVEQCATPEIIYAEPATPFVATFVGVANLVPGVIGGGVASTGLGTVRLVGEGRANRGHALVLLRPEHLEPEEMPDGFASVGAWRVLGRRFAGSEILLDIVSPAGERLWCAAGPRVRQLRVGDAVDIRLRDVETVCFSQRRASGLAEGEPTSHDEPGEASPEAGPVLEERLAPPS